ncbi:MFS antiporter QDR2 [Candida viswanathii]|uniref:MFS antiporter QDR2 n=1 Tax=Candida viswanathii TaxID=5486 RepID=A0A367XPI0_9ASCO|nr:MFS antiporter QDR2 [Candida viswanathii]
MTEKNPSKELEAVQTQSEHEAAYSIFDSGDRLILILLLSSVGFWSTISSPIYFPALPTLTSYFHTTPSVMNVSVVAYLVFQGIAPTVSSNLADTFGRRPVILASLLIFCASCIAISQTNVYWLLAVLRCVQAAGIGPVISISSGVAGDVCTRSTRGGMVGAVAGFQLVGNGIGGLVGAALITGFHTWRSIFIFLAIGGGVTFVVSVFALPETSRRIVGNGSIMPKNVLNKSALIYLPRFRERMTNDVSTLVPMSKFDVFGPLKIFFQVDVFCTLLPLGMHFAAWTVVLTSLSTELESDKYNYSVMHVGLIYLPQGLACFVGSLIIGRCLNWYYRRRKEMYNRQMEEVALEDRPPFNIVATRLTLTVIPATLMIIGLVIFGWCIQYRRHIISIIISTILVSFSASVLVSICTTMMVDLYPNNGSGSASCLNLMRCLLAALFTGVLDQIISSMGLGGTYTLIAGICLLSDLGLVYVLYSASKKFKNFQLSDKGNE